MMTQATTKYFTQIFKAVQCNCVIPIVQYKVVTLVTRL